jgi:adenylate cyclase
MTSVLVSAAALAIAKEASRYFETSFRQREESFNFDIVGARAAEVESTLSDLIYKSRLAAGSLHSGDFQLSSLRDKHFFGLELRDANDHVIFQKWNEAQIREVCGCDSSVVTRSAILEEKTFHFDDDHQVTVRNSTVDGGPQMFSIAFPFRQDSNVGAFLTVVAFVDLGAIQRSFTENRERTFFAVDESGHLLGHTNEMKLLSRLNYSAYDAVRWAEKSHLPRGQKWFENSPSGVHVYSAFAKTSYGVTMFSEVPEEIILEPTLEVRRQVILVAGVTLSCALFLVFLFSITLTGPIERLAFVTRAYTKGRLYSLNDCRLTHRFFDDEVGSLVRSFERLLIGLRDRDLMKSFFRKFHGSPLADKIAKGNISLTGSKKNAVVFFCDLRGFTTFSEKHEPEEVFNMLNEYFGAMVNIITSEGGLVDKFIGDAIMAVWGTPIATDSDAKNAVRACLKMRIALNRLNKSRLDRGKDPLFMGMGLHAGQLISGVVGSAERMEFTVIGNTVNTASRIEGMTKHLGVDLLISEPMKRLICDDFTVEYAGETVLRGHGEVTKLYSVLGYKAVGGDLDAEITTPYSTFEKLLDEKVESDLLRTIPGDLVEPLQEVQHLVNERTGKFVDMHKTMEKIIASYIDGYLRTYHLQIRMALPEEVVKAVSERDQGECQARTSGGEKCGSKNMIHLHHLVRPSDGGENIAENLITLCYDHQREWARRKLKSAA